MRLVESPRQCVFTGTVISPLSTCGQPARVGDVLQFFVTGLGKATPNGDPAGAQLATGKVAPAAGPLDRTVDQPIATIGGIPVEAQFSGIAPGFAGLYQSTCRFPPACQPAIIRPFPSRCPEVPSIPRP